MARRLPSVPPVLPGFSYLHILGTGGFADVFLYEQNMPRRQVAVKVMLNEVVGDQVRHMFQAEANLMAQLSAHPGILTVYQAGVSSDGRPFLVMELCSAVLNERYRKERIPVAEVLRIAVKIGSALETVHRAGVLHRDIKPSNILTTSYGNPVLSDFGIAATLQTARDEEAIGLSIPWSSPEVLIDDVPGSVASEVWSYAATVYSLLAGRSPFEVPGGDNGASALMGRISRAHPLAIDRPDVPDSLERALRRAMNRRPEQRPATVLELVRELQAIESELGLGQTPVELAVDDWAVGGAYDVDDRTRLRPVAIGAGASRSERRRRTRAATGAGAFGIVEAGSLPSRAPTGSVPPPLRRRAGTWLVGGLVALAVALGAAALVVAISSTNTGIPRVDDVTATTSPDGTIEFSWSDPGLAEGDRYQIEVAGGTSSIQTAPRYVVDADPGETVCITVAVNRAGSNGARSAERCADAAG